MFLKENFYFRIYQNLIKSAIYITKMVFIRFGVLKLVSAFIIGSMLPKLRDMTSHNSPNYFPLGTMFTFYFIRFKQTFPKHIRIAPVIILSIMILSFSGCESLPEGEPPIGPIVSIESNADQPMPLKAAINQMITALATSPELTKDKILPNIIPGTTTSPEKYKVQLAMSSINVYSRLLTMGVIDTDPTKQANYILSSTFVKLLKTPSTLKEKPVFKWEMSLTKPGATNPEWNYSLKVFLEERVDRRQ